MVAAATHSLCDAANAMVQGQASEEKLISSLEAEQQGKDDDDDDGDWDSKWKAKQLKWASFTVKTLEEKLKEVESSAAKYGRKLNEGGTADRLAKYNRKIEKRSTEREWLMDRINEKIAALEWSPGDIDVA